MKLGFVGVGNMGNPMALNLLKAGHALQVYDIKQEAASNLLEDGAAWVESPKAAATGVEAICLSLPMPAHVEEVVLADNGALGRYCQRKNHYRYEHEFTNRRAKAGGTGECPGGAFS